MRSRPTIPPILACPCLSFIRCIAQRDGAINFRTLNRLRVRGGRVRFRRFLTVPWAVVRDDLPKANPSSFQCAS